MNKNWNKISLFLLFMKGTYFIYDTKFLIILDIRTTLKV